MPAESLLLTLVFLTSSLNGVAGTISGQAVNGSAGDSPLAEAEIVLRASQDGAFVPIAETTTDAAGRFEFEGLPLDAATIYLAGVNRAGVHYPGSRVRLSAAQPSANIKLVAFEAVPSPSPLICERHDIRIEANRGIFEVTESLVIINPSRTAFVGQASGEAAPVTLRLALPGGFDKITFDKEFHARHFRIEDGALVTELPWPPGKRELAFTYRLPVEQHHSRLARVLDLPTDQVQVRIRGVPARSVRCSISADPFQEDDYVRFFQNGARLAAGHALELDVGGAPLRLETYGRWLAVAILVLVVIGSVVAPRRR